MNWEWSPRSKVWCGAFHGFTTKDLSGLSGCNPFRSMVRVWWSVIWGALPKGYFCTRDGIWRFVLVSLQGCFIHNKRLPLILVHLSHTSDGAILKYYDEISPFSQNILHKQNINSPWVNSIIIFEFFKFFDKHSKIVSKVLYTIYPKVNFYIDRTIFIFSKNKLVFLIEIIYFSNIYYNLVIWVVKLFKVW
jgi:hypothetical protein